MRTALLVLLVACMGRLDSAHAQERDSLWAVELSPVVVTATRTQRALADVPVPISVIGADQIEVQGALRLSDLLAEQPGLALSYDHGVGLQVQGFEAGYTLVLIDGQPLIGRTAGTLRLDRITVANVKRVEIVRGPSSSLYGSDALAGVVNVITRDPQQPFAATLRTRYGTHGTMDLSARIEGTHGPFAASVFFDRYASGGYDLTPTTVAPTVPAFTDYAARTELSYALAPQTDLSLRARVAAERQESTVQVNGEEQLFASEARRVDWSVGPRLEHRFRPGLTLSARLYMAGFHTQTDLTGRADGAVLQDARYNQRYGKAEAQLQAALGARHLVTAGAGYILETVDADRVTGTRTGGFVFVQDEWQTTSWLELVPSLRLDAHSDYATRLSPKLAALARPADWFTLRAAVGSGYKAPAFRQLYLTFTNARVGYSVFGAEEVRTGLRRLEEQGRIQTYLRGPETLGDPLEAESSISFNVGFTVDPTDWLTARVNLFHNEVNHLIDTQPVARKTNGQQVFSYFNLNEVFTRGVEAEVTLRPVDALVLILGYTYLEAKDREVLRALEAGDIYRRTPDGRDVAVSVSAYGGLPGRSKHSISLRLTYRLAPLGLTASLRGRYRGRYGFADLSGNGIIDTDAEYAPDYALLDVTLTKALFRDHALQVGVENLTGHTAPRYVPFLSGRRWFAGLRLRF